MHYLYYNYILNMLIILRIKDKRVAATVSCGEIVHSSLFYIK